MLLQSLSSLCNGQNNQWITSNIFIQDSVKQHFSPQPNSSLYRRVIFCVQSHYEVGYAPQCCTILHLTVKSSLSLSYPYDFDAVP